MFSLESDSKKIILTAHSYSKRNRKCSPIVWLNSIAIYLCREGLASGLVAYNDTIMHLVTTCIGK